MAGPFMPNLGTWPDGRASADWPDVADPRWLVACFLRSGVGASVVLVDRFLAWLDGRYPLGENDSAWPWQGNDCLAYPDGDHVRLEYFDRDTPPLARPLSLTRGELRSIIVAWRGWVAHIQPAGDEPEG